MKLKLKKRINKVFVFILFVLISITLALSILGYIYKSFPKLSDFKILDIKEEKNGLYLYTSKCYNAKSYNIVAYDQNDNIIFEKNNNSNKIDISSINLDYDDLAFFKVTTVSEKNETKTSSNTYKYTNNSASFSKLKDHFINKDEDIVLDLIGFSNNEKYRVELFYKGIKILKKEVNDTFVIFNYNEIEKYNGRITAKLYNKNNRVISTFNFYLNAPIVGNLNIISPTDGFVTSWDDVNLYFTGGNNATDLTVKIYNKKNKLVYFLKKNYENNPIILDANIFKENEEYKIELTASYSDYMEISKTDSINITVLDKKTVKPVYVDKNPTFIKSGTQVSLLTNTENATIYYTLNGKEPDSNSLVYTKPITINSNTIIKTYAVKDNMFDSDINTYEFKVKEKELVVYLSPSNQYSNKGVKEAGYTNEMDMMNKLTDYLEEELKNAGVTVYRNKSSGNINAWLAESNSKKSDFHFAIHSNASINHDVKGMEIYVDKSTSKSFSIASNIYNNLYEIYPYRDEITDRGVKYASGALGEANDNFIKCGALIEIAYHDNYYDALWIAQNMKNIAQNIANSILEFYQIEE